VIAAITATWYPARPKPWTVPVTYGAITDVCRHASRASGFDTCNSTLGPSKVDNASAIAYA